MNKNLSIACLLIVILCLTSHVVLAQKQDAQDTGVSSRQIVLDRFNKARPAEDATAGISGGRTSASVKAPIYRRTGAIKLAAGARRTKPAPSEEIGVTVWRLRPSQSSDVGARVVVLDGLRQTEMTPERIEADTPLNIGDRVRLTIESPRPGFLYIIDREQYADGSFGEPMLIFPTLHTRGGDNRVAPGRLIDIPAQEDQYSYFTAQPTGNRRDQIAEVLTVIAGAPPPPVSAAPMVAVNCVSLTGVVVTLVAEPFH